MTCTLSAHEQVSGLKAAENQTTYQIFERGYKSSFKSDTAPYGLVMSHARAFDRFGDVPPYVRRFLSSFERRI